MESGSVWESNPQGALFKPPTSFEDWGPHQRCKHSQGGRTHCTAGRIAEKTASRPFWDLQALTRKRAKDGARRRGQSAVAVSPGRRGPPGPAGVP